LARFEIACDSEMRLDRVHHLVMWQGAGSPKLRKGVQEPRVATEWREAHRAYCWNVNEPLIQLREEPRHLVSARPIA